MKKIVRFLFVLLVLTGCSNAAKKVNEREITMHITMINQIENTTLLDEEICVEGKIATLSDFLFLADELEAELSEGGYGLQIDSLMGLDTSWNSGPWWVYESENNQSCVEMGMCDAISSLAIEEGNHFVFKYTKSFE